MAIQRCVCSDHPRQLISTCKVRLVSRDVLYAAHPGFRALESSRTGFPNSQTSTICAQYQGDDQRHLSVLPRVSMVCHGSSRWAALPSELLSHVIAQADFDSRLACQSVCSTWLQYFLSPSALDAFFWSKRLVLVQVSTSRDVLKYELASWRDADEDHDQLMLPLPSGTEAYSFCMWMRNRLTSWECVAFGTKAAPVLFDEPALGGCVPALLLGVLAEVSKAPKLHLHLKGKHAKHLQL